MTLLIISIFWHVGHSEWAIDGFGGLTVFWTLAGNCSDVEKKSLAQEIELGKSLDGNKHPNIVNFLGCVSTSGNAFCVFWL